jgi:acyl-coenzyme A synthetase/AMP-(fatty) acid ligase
MPDALTAPLTDRAPGEVMFRRVSGPVTVGRFLADVAALAARLPDRPYALNLCADRYHALLGLAAALTRGQVMLLSADRTERRQHEIAAAYPDLYVMADAAAGGEAEPGWQLPFGALPVSAMGEGEGGPVPEIPLGRTAIIGFTSGSTGEPAAHPKPWGALVAATRAAAARFGLRGPAVTTVVATVPPQHMYGFELTLAMPFHAATASQSGPWFYPVEVAEALHDAPAPRLLVTTPLQMRALLGSGEELPELAAVVSATAPLAPELAAACEAGWDTPVLEIYGATEIGSIASRRTTTGEAWTLYDGVGLRPAGEDTLVDVPGMPAPVPLADAVEFRPDGGFRLIGRRADMVKLGGKRASLASLNRLLLQVPGVEDGVFAAPADLDSNPAARLVVYAVAPGQSAAGILAALRGQMDPVFLPRRVLRVAALPRNAMGKLTRAALDGLRQQVLSE